MGLTVSGKHERFRTDIVRVPYRYCDLRIVPKLNRKCRLRADDRPHGRADSFAKCIAPPRVHVRPGSPHQPSLQVALVSSQLGGDKIEQGVVHDEGNRTQLAASQYVEGLFMIEHKSTDSDNQGRFRILCQTGQKPFGNYSSNVGTLSTKPKDLRAFEPEYP